MDSYLLYLALAFLGVWIGAFVNTAVEWLRMFEPRLLSPWWPWRPEGANRRVVHFVPVLGWFFRDAKSEQLSKRFWLRPFLIEVAFLAGTPALFWWEQQGGLVEPALQDTLSGSAPAIWFGCHLLLITLMAIATFTDFDERVIPDEITLPGTVLALILAWSLPYSALPYSEAQPGQPTRPTLEYLRFDFPGYDPFAAVAWGGSAAISQVQPEETNESETGGLPQVCESQTSLAIAVLIVVSWCFVLAPKRLTLRYGFLAGLRLMFASLLRPARKTKPKKRFKLEPRRPSLYSRLLLGIAFVGVLFVTWAWFAGGVRWYSLYSSLIGIVGGAVCVWSVRIIGSFALQREAMGFGDVTLLAMIGAFLGWQPALLVFALAPFTCLIIVFLQYLATGDNELAFGPYLCLAAAILILFWPGLWNEWAGPMIFSMGSVLVWILLGMLVPMYLCFAGMRLLRGS